MAVISLCANRGVAVRGSPSRRASIAARVFAAATAPPAIPRGWRNAPERWAPTPAAMSHRQAPAPPASPAARRCPSLLHCRRDGGKIILYQPRLRTEAHFALLRVIQLPFLQLAVVQIAEGTVLVQPGNSLRRWLLAQVLRRRAQHHAVLSQRPGPQRPGIGRAPDTHRKIKPLLQQIDLPVAVVELELQ